MMDACDEPDCASTLRELDVFLDEELSDAAHQSIAHHLDACPTASVRSTSMPS